MPLNEVACAELLDDTGLASTAIADQDDFEQIIEALISARLRHQAVGVAVRHPLLATLSRSSILGLGTYMIRALPVFFPSW